jgi:tetratricopeptide (TPR) repeat protein
MVVGFRKISYHAQDDQLFDWTTMSKEPCMPERPRLNRAPSRRGRRIIQSEPPSALVHGEAAWNDAVAASHEGNGRRAISRLAEAEAAFLVAGRSDLAARTLAQRAVLLTAEGDHADAVLCMEKARAEAGDWPAENNDDRARFMMAYGQSLAALGDHSEAVHHLGDAMQLLANAGLDTLAAAAALEIAASLTVLNRHRDAAAFAEAAQIGFTSVGEPALAAHAMRIAAHAHEREGNLIDAVAAHEVAQLGFVATGAPEAAATSACDQSRVLQRIGRDTEDADCVRTAIERLEAALGTVDGYPAAACAQALGTSLIDLGAIESDLATIEAAVPHLFTAFDAFVELGAFVEAAQTAEQLSISLRLLGRGDEALELLGRAVAATQPKA